MPKSYVNKCRVAIVVAVFILIAVIIAIAVTLSIENSKGNGSKDSEDVTKEPLRVDCYMEAEGIPGDVSESVCRQRGCAYDARPSGNQPACYYREGQYGLTVTDTVTTPSGVEVGLRQIGSAPFGGDIREWRFTFLGLGSNMARFTLDPVGGEKRYRVPVGLDLPVPSTSRDTEAYRLRITNNQSFAFQIIRKDTGTVIWDTGIEPVNIILSDQFLQMGTKLPSTYVYGLGEHSHETFRHNLHKNWPSFSRDQWPSERPEANLYGVHPVYTCVEDSKGNTHGVFMFNSNAQEYAFNPLPSLTFRTIGGVLDFFLFMGPSPEEVVKQFTSLVGRPVMPPYWALGFQLCRYGYNNITNLMDAVDSTSKYNIPHDVQYVDIDHMDERKIFTVDNVNFPNLNDYFLTLRASGKRIIYILDPCLISNETNYEPYQKMRDVDGNIKWAENATVPANSSDINGAILGYVWPKGAAVFIDFFKESAKQEWKALIEKHRNTLIFDGIWIDMNEPASFGTNEERAFNWPEDAKPYWSLHCPVNSLDDPPYRTKAAYRYDSGKQVNRLSQKTICLNTVQGDHGEYSHYDVHSLYGWSQARATFEAVRSATGERSMVISRSTFPGSGRYAGHWTGDNVSHWKDMRLSIIGMLEFGLFGIPYIGADICGFFQDTTVSLCKRWMQLGAFYPFSRNHNGNGFIPQAPGQLGDDLGHSSREILEIRYRLLPYLYLLFHRAHTEGSTVVRALHHEFPTDKKALSVDRQFLWGSCLMISPILEENQSTLQYYLPRGTWYNYLTGASEGDTGYMTKSIQVDDNSLPMLHLREHCILVTQDSANSTYYSRQEPLTIVVGLDGNDSAKGSFFWDDGQSIDAFENGNYYMASLEIERRNLTLSIEHKPSPSLWNNIHFSRVLIMGIKGSVASVELDESGTITKPKFDLTSVGILNITLPDLSIMNEFSLSWTQS